jgi:hypothetical protein
MKTPLWKIFLTILVVLEVPLAAHLSLQWTALHGFFSGLWFWYFNGADDPVYLAAEMDFLALTAIGLWLLARDWFGLGGKIGWALVLWLVAFAVFPSVTAAVYLLQRHKKPLHRHNPDQGQSDF